MIYIFICFQRSLLSSAAFDPIFLLLQLHHCEAKRKSLLLCNAQSPAVKFHLSLSNTYKIFQNQNKESLSSLTLARWRVVKWSSYFSWMNSFISRLMNLPDDDHPRFGESKHPKIFAIYTFLTETWWKASSMAFLWIFSDRVSDCNIWFVEN